MATTVQRTTLQTTERTMSRDAFRVLIVGAGQAGMHVAARLRRRLRPGETTVIVVDPHSYLTYQPLVAEVAAGNLEPRHVVMPLRHGRSPRAYWHASAGSVAKTLALLFPREIVSLDALEHVHDEFSAAAHGTVRGTVASVERR